MPIHNYEITRTPVEKVGCGRNRCKGILFRLTLSGIEEGLGHEGFECDTCHLRVKYVPQRDGR
jgi:hypothetical protein